MECCVSGHTCIFARTSSVLVLPIFHSPVPFGGSPVAFTIGVNRLLNKVSSISLAVVMLGGRNDSIGAGCSKKPSSAAAASEKAEAYPLLYVEALSDARTKLEDFFNVLLDL